MMTNTLRRIFAAGIFLFMALVSGAAAGQYERIVAFATASDSGNAFVLLSACRSHH
jgi:hypothetical protein